MDGRGRLAEPLTWIARARALAPAGATRGAARAASRLVPDRRVPALRRSSAVASRLRSLINAAAAARRRHCRGGAGAARRALGYGVVRGGHVPTIIDALQGRARRGRQRGRLPHRLDRARRAAAREPRGDPRHRRRHRPHVAAVPRRRRGARAAQGQSLDRRRHGAQALSGPAADRHHRARGLRALAEGRQGRRHRRRRHRARALSSTPRLRSCRWWSARGAEAQAKDFLALLDRYPEIRDQVRAAILVAERRWNLRLKNGIDVRLPETDVEQALERWSTLDRDKKLLSRDIARDRSAPARPRHRAALRRGRAGARAKRSRTRSRRRREGKA